MLGFGAVVGLGLIDFGEEPCWSDSAGWMQVLDSDKLLGMVLLIAAFAAASRSGLLQKQVLVGKEGENWGELVGCEAVGCFRLGLLVAGLNSAAESSERSQSASNYSFAAEIDGRCFLGLHNDWPVTLRKFALDLVVARVRRNGQPEESWTTDRVPNLPDASEEAEGGAGMMVRESGKFVQTVRKDVVEVAAVLVLVTMDCR